MQDIENEVKIWRKDIKCFEENPFIDENSVKIDFKKKTVYTKTAGLRVSISDGEDEVQGITATYTTQEVDEKQFVKLYTQNIRALYELSSAGFKLFTLILRGMQKLIGQDIIFFNYETANNLQKEIVGTKLARATFERAIFELVQKGFLAPTKDKYLFFINLNLFFNGNRAIFITEYQKKKTNKNNAIEGQGSLFELEEK